MGVIQKILNTEQVSYSSNLNTEDIKAKVENLFVQNDLHLGGKLTGESGFEAYDKLNVIGWNVPNLRRRSAYLSGDFTPEENGTIIRLKINPNSALPVFAILAILVGVVLLVVFSGTADEKLYSTIAFIFIALGVIYYPVSSLLRNRLRDRVVKSLGLKKV